MPETKLSKLKAAWASGDGIGSLRIAAKFQQLGEHKEAITRAWAAFQSPAFYRGIGQEPDALLAEGLVALAERYDLAPLEVPRGS